jgi:hypothetical protein
MLSSELGGTAARAQYASQRRRGGSNPGDAPHPSHRRMMNEADVRSEGHIVHMTYESTMAFADAWIAAWNRRDVEAVLAHYSDEAQFVSPVARNLVGRPILRNKKELEDYWRSALARISVLEFKLDHAAWDEKRPRIECRL